MAPLWPIVSLFPGLFCSFGTRGWPLMAVSLLQALILPPPVPFFLSVGIYNRSPSSSRATCYRDWPGKDCRTRIGRFSVRSPSTCHGRLRGAKGPGGGRGYRLHISLHRLCASCYNERGVRRAWGGEGATTMVVFRGPWPISVEFLLSRVFFLQRAGLRSTEACPTFPWKSFSSPFGTSFGFQEKNNRDLLLRVFGNMSEIPMKNMLVLGDKILDLRNENMQV